MPIHVNNLRDEAEIPGETEDLLRNVAEAALARAGRGGSEAGITLADDAYLQELNRAYRGIDAPTDVLAFAMLESAPGEPPCGEAGPELMGDVVISLERARAQADEYGHSLRRELAYLAVHGMLHLLGYDHASPDAEQKMREAAEEILAANGLGREA